MIASLTHTDLTNLKEKIEDALDDWSVKTYKQEPRNHLGISEIGDDCKRKLFYKFRWMGFETFDGRMLRLLTRGHREEEKYVNYLKGIGFKIFRHDENGKQFRVSGVMGHYGGSCDGVGISPWHLDVPMILEFKTHNTKSFVGYIADGLQKAKPQHYDQMSGYGQKLKIEYGLYFPENKNDDDIKVTPIKLDWNRGIALEKKAEEIITAVEPPPKISENPAFYKCQYCFARQMCHYGAIPQKNCRSCKNCKATENASWTCSKFGVIPPDFIKIGCPEWMPI